MIKKLNFDKEKIIQRINDIDQAVLELKRFQEIDFKEFQENKDNYALACYYLRIAIEGVLSISTHLLSRLPSNGKKKDYSQSILSLGEYGVLPLEFAKKIKGMAGLRNRLVHLYWEVDPKEIFSIINQDVKDFNKFIQYIQKYLKAIK